MAWRAGAMDYLWTNWVRACCPLPKGGDQAWIESALREEPDLLQDLYPGLIGSFKVHGPGAPIVCYHGQPKPHNCGSNLGRAFWGE